ncbi:MAG TPA: PilZ domain-containing protein [Candidatus Angelobacter sp.]|nr:PilZ domain-containing protein [Candidatus Angelobacter sp.]
MATQTTARIDPQRTAFRRWQRYRLNLPIRLIVSRDATTRITNGRAADISQGGVLVFAGIELKNGSEVFVEFTEPYSGEAIRARGLVRHRRGYNYGVEFVTETTGDQEQADKFRALLRMAAGSATP